MKALLGLILAATALMTSACSKPSHPESQAEINCSGTDSQLNTYTYQVAYLRGAVYIHAVRNGTSEVIKMNDDSPYYATKTIYVNIDADRSYKFVATENDSNFVVFEVINEVENQTVINTSCER